jgi:hypothetical protein
MNWKKSTTLKLLIVSSILYIVFALIATGIAIVENRTTEFGGSISGLSPLQSFLYGQGTAMSPSLTWLMFQGILVAIALRKDRWGIAGVAGLFIFGLFFLIGMLGEPILLETFKHASVDILKSAILAGMLIVPLAMMVFGILE